jgi:hypothetical protein
LEGKNAPQDQIAGCTVYTGAVQYGLAVSSKKALNISGAYMLGEKSHGDYRINRKANE